MLGYKNSKLLKTTVFFNKKNIMRIGIFGVAVSMAVLFSANSMRTYALGDIGSYSLISESAVTGGQGGNNDSNFLASISQDGSTVVFESTATDLVASDTNGKKDIFYRKASGGAIKRASISSSGIEGDKDSTLDAISSTGRYIAYTSTSTTLEGGLNPYNQYHHYVYDTKTEENTHLPYVYSSAPRGISDDGRFIAMTLQPALRDINGVQINASRISLYDRKLDTWTRLDSPVAGGEQHQASKIPSMNCDGSFVVYESGLTNITGETDSNGPVQDIILVDLRHGLGLKNITQQFNGYSSYADISCNGRYITFTSAATDIDTTTTGISPPATGNYSNQVYRYDRINETYALVSQTTAGQLMDNAGTGYSYSQHAIASDDGRVYFATKNSAYAQPQDFVRTRVRNIDAQTTHAIQDTGLQYFYITPLKRAVDSQGKSMVFRANRGDVIPTANNNKTQVFLGKLD